MHLKNGPSKPDCSHFIASCLYRFFLVALNAPPRHPAAMSDNFEAQLPAFDELANEDFSYLEFLDPSLLAEWDFPLAEPCAPPAGEAADS